MTFDWYQYLVLAEHLYDNRDTFPDREACLRGVISRAYYAAFWSARNDAETFDKLELDGSGKDHGSVRNYYMKSRDTKKRKVGSLLGRLRDFRNEADYLDTIESAEDLAKTAISQSTEVHKLLKQIYRS